MNSSKNPQGVQAPVVFQFQSTNIRTFADDTGGPWFCANDVCEVLGYANPRDAISKHCRESGVAKRDTSSGGQNRELTFINEGNLYRLIIKSKKPEAEKFEQQVMDEILPAIRKTGGYMGGQTNHVNQDNTKAILNATKMFAATVKAMLPNHNQRQCYMMANNQTLAATGIDMLAMWKLLPAELDDTEPTLPGRQSIVAIKTRQQKLLDKFIHFLKNPELLAPHDGVARHNEILRRLHVTAEEFKTLVGDAIRNNVVQKYDGAKLGYGGTVYSLIGGAA